ncbi:hypothetical protein L484_021231 [Morus notabilis]|uniref:BURP domain-containing protein n=1 Tax=Morus notabilis TaxID=981085 RepID=W9S137_9ROSA|nr:hypothetical protein L484_021231 [Morus notabilis]
MPTPSRALIPPSPTSQFWHTVCGFEERRKRKRKRKREEIKGESENKVYKISLGGENGDKVEAVAFCHMDTSHWSRDHVSFRVLRIEPGTFPVCHFFPADHLVWVPTPSTK